MRYGSKPLEFAKGKNAIELGSEAEVADVLAKVREAAELGELDALDRKASAVWQTSDTKEQVNRKNRRTCGLSTFFVLQCATRDCVNY